MRDNRVVDERSNLVVDELTELQIRDNRVVDERSNLVVDELTELWMRDLDLVVIERLAVNAKVATVRGSIPQHPTDRVESERQQMKQC